MCAVVDDLAWTCHSSRFEEIDTHTLAAIDDVGCTHAKATQLPDARRSDIVFRQSGHKLHILTIVSQRHSHISLATAKCCHQLVALPETQMVGGSQTQHYLSKCNNLCHIVLVHLYTKLQKIIVIPNFAVTKTSGQGDKKSVRAEAPTPNIFVVCIKRVILRLAKLEKPQFTKCK